MPGIVIATGHHLCRNPRVHKEAVALAAAGYDVEVHAPVFADDLLALDEELEGYGTFRRVVPTDLRSGTLLKRIVRKSAMELNAKVSIEGPAALGYGVRSHLRAARRARADLVIGHQEIGTWVIAELTREGRRIGADFEDWYSNDLLPEVQRYRPLNLIRRCEQTAMHASGHLTTTSRALAHALQDTYGGRLPIAIYNAFPLHHAGQAELNWQGPLAAIWFSQRVGPGRGLETIVRAVAHTHHPVSLHLVGAIEPAYQQELLRLAGESAAHRLTFQDPVPPGTLRELVSRYDLGFAFEQTQPPSRNLTITNKILMYLLAGVAVIASPTAGQSEVAAIARGAVSLCSENDVTVLAKCIDELAGAPDRLLAAKRAALKAAADVFCWEKQRDLLLESVSEALKA